MQQNLLKEHLLNSTIKNNAWFADSVFVMENVLHLICRSNILSLICHSDLFMPDLSQ